jgi:hypothetical protein
MIELGGGGPVFRAPENASKNKHLIISTGDISDVDGFFALAKYAQSGADVLFIMNYPAYFNADKEKDIKTGFKFNEAEYFAISDADLTNRSAKDGLFRLRYERYMLLDSIYPGLQDSKKRLFTDLGFILASRVWDTTDVDQKGNLYFCIGGINSNSPIAAEKLKNELFVYSEYLTSNDKVDLACYKEGYVYDIDKNAVNLDSILFAFDSIFVDFNGSMAFYDSNWRSSINKLCLQGRIKSVFVMGGVFSYEKPRTMPSIEGILERLSCATMNQLYSAEKTFMFFTDMKTNEIDVFVVPNNAVHDLVKVENGWSNFLITNSINTQFLYNLGFKYYYSHYNPPQKLFDYYTALALTETIKGNYVLGRSEYLYYDPTFGVSLIGNIQNDWKSVITRYYEFIDSIPEDTAFNISIKQKFKSEKASLEKYIKTTSIPVQILQFTLELSNLKLDIA